jgi:hypothetical protein
MRCWLMAGFKSKDEPRGIHAVASDKVPQPLIDAIGQLDGLYQIGDGDLLAADWVYRSLFS